MNWDGVHHFYVDATDFDVGLPFRFQSTVMLTSPKRKEPYKVSPWALIWAEENYYLVAYDETEDCIKHFRVDKMKSVTALKEKRKGKRKFNETELASYSNMNFGMFGGEEKDVRIAFTNEMVGVIIDRFGKEIMIHDSDKTGWSETVVRVAVSRHFFGWIFALGTDVAITGPVDVVKMFEKDIEDRKKMINNKK